MAQVHVSGHGSREEIKLMLALLKPRYVVPVHGEYRMLAQHARAGDADGRAGENVVIAQDGDVIEVERRSGGIHIVDLSRAAMCTWMGWVLAMWGRSCCATGVCSPAMACWWSW